MKTDIETPEEMPIENKPYMLLHMPLFVFKWSLILGTACLLFHFLLVPSDQQHYFVILVGLFYAIPVVAINIIIFLATITASFWHQEYQNQIISNALIQLINIPIALLYLFIVAGT